MTNHSNLLSDSDLKESLSLESELKIVRSLLKDQIKSNRILEEQNLHYSSANILLDNKCQELSAKLGIKAKDPTGKLRENINNCGEIGLEIEMLKAKISSSILKSIVSPLEKEVEFLRNRVNEAESCLYVSSHKPIKVLPEIPIETISNGESAYDSACPIDSNDKYSVLELTQRLEQAEIFVLSVVKNNSELNKKLNKIKKEFDDLTIKYEKEITAHVDLKSTWKRANEEFIVQSVNFQKEIQNLKESHLDRSSLSPNSLIDSEHTQFQKDIYSNETILIQAELARCKQELINEKNKISGLETILKNFTIDASLQISKSESDCLSLDSILFDIQQELIKRETQMF